MTRFHGVMSVTLVGIAIGIALWVLVPGAWGWAAGYVALCGVGMGAILYAYCAKCPCKQCCAHVLPGMIAGRFPRKPGPYSTAEQVAVVVVLLLILGLPQLWLWRNVTAGFVFWALTAIAAIQILAFICGRCPNIHCPVGKMRGGEGKQC